MYFLLRIPYHSAITVNHTIESSLYEKKFPHNFGYGNRFGCQLDDCVLRFRGHSCTGERFQLPVECLGH